MSIRPYREINRRKSRQIYVGDVPVGGDAPITVQSMTNTLTSDAKATIAQIHELEEAGAFGIPHEELGETLALAVETVENAVVTEEELLEFAREKLGGYMVPMKIIFTKTLPRDPSGKIYKRKLRDPFWANEKRKI